MMTKVTFPAPNAQTSALWRIPNAICQRREFDKTQTLARIGLNRRVIRCTPVYNRPQPQ